MDPQSALAETTIDNDATRVTKWTLEPNTRIGRHRHDLPYVVVPIVGGAIVVSDEYGDTSSQLVAGQPYFRPAGAQHTVSNHSTNSIVFVEVEFRDK